MYDFFERFIEPQRSLCNELVGNISLDLDPDFEDMDYPTVDILPYLKLSATAPQLQIRMHSSYDGGALRALAGVKESPCWALNVQSMISRVLLQFDPESGVQIEIEVKYEYAENWMLIKASAHEFKIACGEWFERVGLCALVKADHHPGVSLEGQPGNRTCLSRE